jgi:hypothetical protein
VIRASTEAKRLLADVRAAVEQEAAKAQPGAFYKKDKGDRLPLFVWLRSARRNTHGSPVEYILLNNSVVIHGSRTTAAAEVFARVMRRKGESLSVAQVSELLDHIQTRYRARGGNNDHDIVRRVVDKRWFDLRHIDRAIARLCGITFQSPLPVLLSSLVAERLAIATLVCELRPAVWLEILNKERESWKSPR